jgi:putative ABC transport system permease protein
VRWWRRKEREQDLERELRSDLELEAAEQQENGLSAEEARYAARRAFGNPTLVKEEVREMWFPVAIEQFGKDLRYAARTLRRDRAFTAVVIATLALGIGANTAIFSVCNAVWLKPLPYPEPDRILMLWEHPRNKAPGTVSAPNFVDWRDQNHAFSQMAAISLMDSVLTGQGEPRQLAGAAVTADFFSLLGTRMRIGRNFLNEEDQPGKNHVAILSHATWQRYFGGQPGIAGRQITLSNIPYTVVGVLPDDFEFVSKASDFQARTEFDVWVLLALAHNLEPWQRGTHPLRVFARLKPGFTPAQAQADLNVIASNLERLYPAFNKDKDITAVPLSQQVTAHVRTALATLLGAVGLMLLIACANVANLMLSRAAARQKEIALRLALGASTGRLTRQLLVESSLLAGLGGLLGLILASAAIRALTPWLPADLPRSSTIGIDTGVILFTGLVSLATGIVFGLTPLAQVRRVNANESLKQGTRVAGGVQPRLRSALAAAQIALAFVLLTGAGLMAKSFWTLMHVAPGFRTEHILTARLSLPMSHYPDARRIAAFQRDLLERVRSAPGVQSAGLAGHLPLSGTDNNWSFDIEGRPPRPQGADNVAGYRPVSPGYFETLAIPLLRGRGFTPADTESTPLVVVINEAMARAWWPRQDPLGQRLRFQGRPAWRTVIGVAGDVHHEGLDAEAHAEIYAPYAQMPNIQLAATLVVRTATEPTAVTASVRQAVAGIDADLPIARVETMQQIVSASVGQPRFRTTLLAAFAVLALVMASIGIYGVMNYLVSQRIREFGVRLAVGASAADVLWLVLRRAAVLIAGGLCVGLLGSVLLTRLIATLLYGVAPLDAPTFAAVSLILSGVAFVASYIPARRATRVDPIVALRHE